MKIYYCPNCKTKYLENELYIRKCSENYVGSEKIDFCKNCLKNKKKFIKLKEE